MKKSHNEYEDNSLAVNEPITAQSLTPSVANRLRKNLCQDLSSQGGNSLHCVPEPERVTFKV
ncbi:hypothetical protein DA391_05635 [Yersinia massiliensis]|uniref:Uncharacterized protein n=1 Tax=Yersinia massiliensis TaxID=419257 RepID=A0ABM6UQL1_9GAMM|nr:hypothetical protein DA391_05635 [Yersinia massiliensis]